MTNIVFLTHASSESGYGHLNRCLLLADAFKNEGCDVAVYVVGNELLSAFVASRPYVVVCPYYPSIYPTADLCIVDLYEYDDDFYTDLRSSYNWIAIFDDDQFQVPYGVSAIINPNVYASQLQYPPGYGIFAGPQYVMVRKEFTADRRSSDPSNVLICTGASDPCRQMHRWLNIMVEKTNRIIDAIFGPAFEYPEVIIQWQGHSQVNVHKTPDTLVSLYCDAAYALTGAGSMLYELNAMRVPAISVALAENQTKLGESMASLKRNYYLGMYSDVSDENIQNAIDHMEQEACCISGEDSGLIDGNGGRRLAYDILKWLNAVSDETTSPYDVEAVKQEYEVSALMQEEHSKMRWATYEGMINRYKLVTSELDFYCCNNWLDVGCGTGLFQKLVLGQYPSVFAVGLELASGLHQAAVARSLERASFANVDFVEFQTDDRFDIITCIGVMAKSNVSVPVLFTHVERLLNNNGRLLVDFKNRKWNKFQEPSFYPEPRHSWFDIHYILDVIEGISSLKVEKCFGYLAKENRVVDVNESHTFCLIASKQ